MPRQEINVELKDVLLVIFKCERVYCQTTFIMPMENAAKVLATGCPACKVNNPPATAALQQFCHSLEQLSKDSLGFKIGLRLQVP